MKCGGIVLCGGESRRMGAAKASLPFGPETMLGRVIRLLAPVIDPIVVVAAVGQDVPQLPPDVVILRDRFTGRGPLEGLRAGLEALAGKVDAAYASGCDVPLLRPDFVSQMISLLGNHQIVVPVEGEFFHPLAAVYRTAVLSPIEELLEADRLRPVFLYELVDTRRVPVDELRTHDPQLGSLENINRPEDYQLALSMAGLPPLPAD